MPPSWVLGVDSGGSALRVGLARVGPDGAPAPRGSVTAAGPARTGPAGIDAGHLMGLVLPAARSLMARADAEAEAGAGVGAGLRIEAVCVGAAGMATLGDALRAELPDALAAGLGVRRLALAADAVTGYAGALGERPGAVVAAGTGVIALGTDLRHWRRADGWGHLLGDCGGGAWIGRAGLDAALRTHDGREGGSGALLARAVEAFGPAGSLPRVLYPRADRAAVLASFAPAVAGCAAGDPPDPVAARILREAARQIAITARAACLVEDGVVALTGGLFRIGEPLVGAVREELARRLPRARLVPARLGPLEGALLVAARLAAGTLRLPADGSLLHVPE